jgi:hypothetical protein
MYAIEKKVTRPPLTSRVSDEPLAEIWKKRSKPCGPAGDEAGAVVAARGEF